MSRQIAYLHGASPYHVKGNVYVGTKHFFETKVEGGLDVLYVAIDDPTLTTFVQQKFLAVAWYDVLPIVPLVRAEAKAMGLGVKRYILLRSAYQADQDLSGVYRAMLKLASVEQVALRLPRLFTQIFDFGASDAQLVAPGHVEGAVRDFPAVLFEWLSVSLEGYAKQALTLAGGREVTVAHRRLRGNDEKDDKKDELASMHLELRWNAS